MSKFSRSNHGAQAHADRQDFAAAPKTWQLLSGLILAPVALM